MTALSVAREELMLDSLYGMYESVSIDHLLAPIQTSFDSQGRILVSRDGLRQFLHRRFYAVMVENPVPALLYRSCDTWGCQNPFHFTTQRPSLGKCRNGHRYRQQDRQQDGSMRCGQCRDQRNQARRRGGEAHWEAEKRRQFCPYWHEYTPENTYTSPTASGGVRRKCKACALIRSAGGDPADTIAENHSKALF